MPHPFCLHSTPPPTPSWENLFTAHYKYTYSAFLSSTVTKRSLFLITELSFRTTAPFKYFITRMPSCSVTLFFLLLAGPSSTLASPGRGRTGLEGHIRTEGRDRSELTNKGGDKADSRKKTETGDKPVFKPGVTAEEDGKAWQDLGTMFSMFSFSDSRQWEPRSSSHCVPIPTGMALCLNIGYDTMRMPNLLGHESPAEAVQQSASWLPLLARECHPDARIFLCSLFAPICLDRYVYKVKPFKYNY